MGFSSGNRPRKRAGEVRASAYLSALFSAPLRLEPLLDQFSNGKGSCHRRPEAKFSGCKGEVTVNGDVELRGRAPGSPGHG